MHPRRAAVGAAAAARRRGRGRRSRSAWWLAAAAAADARRASATVVAGYARVPRVLPRALATVPLAAAHARRFERAGVEHVHAHFATYPTLAAWIA